MERKGLSEIELIYKPSVKFSKQPKIISSQDAYDVMKKFWDENKISFVEQFKIALLNRANTVIGIVEISTGGITGTVADIRLIIAAAIKSNAVGIILAHNHPSGNCKPSQADIDLTKKIAGAAKLFDVQLLDHLIITDESYLSMAEEGLL
jgi:DNA repair protein RadC